MFIDSFKIGFKKEFDKTVKERREFYINSKGSIIKKIPNVLTVIRIIGSFFVPFLSFDNPSILIFVASVLALTDFFDGLIARHFNAFSKYGALLDTIADKLLSLSLILLLYKIFPLISIIILALEFLIVSINTYARIRGIDTKSSIFGKIKTWFLSVASITGIASKIFKVLGKCASILLIISILFQVITIIGYILNYFKKHN